MFECIVLILGGLALAGFGVALKLIWALAHIVLLPLKLVVGGVVALFATGFAVSLLPLALIALIVLLGTSLIGVVLIIRALS